MVRRRMVLLGAVVLSALSACHTVTNPRVTDIQVAILTSSDKGAPPDSVQFQAVVTNIGTKQVWHCKGCGCGNGITVSVLGPDGLPVLIRDPNQPKLLCPDTSVPLETGEKISLGDIFRGTLYVSNVHVPPTPTYLAPSGTYTVVARFSYATTPDGHETSIERRATFDWIGASSSAR